MESPAAYPESPMMEDDVAFPCKGCGEILEEGKAFELAGNRWHINCFRCNTCQTLLDSDANLLLLGDGSLICNNCTYSCSGCGNKIEDLAILTGDQAFCANCFKCRNCKKKIENLRYARTSQGIFCMDCHESLMARRRKKTARNAAQRTKSSGLKYDKSLPSLPPTDMGLTSDSATAQYDSYPDTPSEPPPRNRPVNARVDSSNGIKRSNSPAAKGENLILPAETFKNKRHSFMARPDDGEDGGMTIPLAFDPTPPIQQSPQLSTSRTPKLVDEQPRDYFNSDRNPARKASTEAQPSPHIAYQEKGRQPSGEIMENIIKRREAAAKVNGALTSSPAQLEDTRYTQQSPNLVRDSSEEKFKLQEVPKSKRAGGSSRSSRSDAISPHLEVPPPLHQDDDTPTPGMAREAPSDLVEKMTENVPLPAKLSSPRPSYEGRTREGTSSELPRAAMGVTQSPQLPTRGDSLGSKTSIPRKEVGASTARPSLSTSTSVTEPNGSPSITSKESDVSSTPKLSSGKSISKPMESPKSKSLFDTVARSEGAKDPFVAPRAAPNIPPPGHRRGDSISTMQSDTARHGEHTSPSLPRWSAGGEFSLDEDMARIMGGDASGNHESFLKRVSNSVRHGRSFSDKGMRLSKEQKWPRSPVVGSTAEDISSPNSASPEHRDELSWFKNELRRERQKAVDRERKIAELEAMINSTSEIKHANSELREKRSTMVVLDAQKEIVVRELEALTDHIANAKKSNEPFDISKFSQSVVRDFGEALAKLRDSYAPKIEEALQTRADLMSEITELVQMKEKSFVEFEQLSLKNAQLAELNNTLVHQIQNLYKANSENKEPEKSAPATNGLGIYSQPKDKSQVSIDSREIRPSIADMSMHGSTQTAMQQEEAEPVTVLQGPQMVNIRKGGQAKKFNWKKGGQNITKGVTKGLKGAFSSTQQSYAREMQFAETGAYGVTPPGTQYSELPRSSDQPAKGFGGFWGAPKGPQQKGSGSQGPYRLPTENDSSSGLVAPDPSTTLFGADLEQRAQFENAAIPNIITKCIEEVELRGMDSEGIYRKSGGNSQTLIVKDGFEKDPQSFDISDPDLDINAVTSGLKQYLRRLPNPLITYEVYDKVLDACTMPSKQDKIEAMQRAIVELPQVHQDVLEFLVFHLKRVIAHEKENLMTSLNIAVVFAPTIMRPESINREMTDTHRKNEAVQFIVENCQLIFLGDHN